MGTVIQSHLGGAVNKVRLSAHQIRWIGGTIGLSVVLMYCLTVISISRFGKFIASRAHAISSVKIGQPYVLDSLQLTLPRRGHVTINQVPIVVVDDSGGEFHVGFAHVAHDVFTQFRGGVLDSAWCLASGVDEHLGHSSGRVQARGYVLAKRVSFERLQLELSTNREPMITLRWCTDGRQ